MIYNDCPLCGSELIYSHPDLICRDDKYHYAVYYSNNIILSEYFTIGNSRIRRNKDITYVVGTNISLSNYPLSLDRIKKLMILI